MFKRLSQVRSEVPAVEAVDRRAAREALETWDWAVRELRAEQLRKPQATFVSGHGAANSLVIDTLMRVYPGEMRFTTPPLVGSGH